MSEQDPPRLLDSSSPYVRSLLQAGESEVPDQAKLAALALKLGPILGGAGGAGGGGAITGKAAAAAKTASVGSALKIAGGTLLAATLAVSSAIYVPKMVGAPTRSTSTGITISDSTATPLATTSTLAPPVETIAPAAAVSASAVRKPAASVESPDAEVKLLERAQDALRTRPTDALALCTEHANRFPQGLLTQEREVIAIEALTQTGKMPEANARADRFAATYPDSSHLRRVGALVGRKF